MKKNKIIFLLFFLSGCFSSSNIKVVDFTDGRVSDLALTKKVIGKKNFLFFTTTKLGIFLEGSIAGVVTDYYGNPIEGVTVKAVSDVVKKEDENIIEENANSMISLNFTPGVSDTMGIYKIRFSLPVIDNEVDVRGRLVYNPGWEQQKNNLGKTYEPQIKESPFRLYYNLENGFLAFAEGVRSVVVAPVGEGIGKMKTLPGQKPPQTKEEKPKTEEKKEEKPATNNEDDIFKAFGF
ncbi:MAG: hypothetical protein N2Z60_02150 [Elusimicrobiales bacterium]|nr:hypothetical protein [Elusimicrobiales bacterium]